MEHLGKKEIRAFLDWVHEGDALSQRSDAAGHVLKVGLVEKNWFASITACDEMVNCIGALNAKFGEPWHKLQAQSKVRPPGWIMAKTEKPVPQ